MKVSLSGMLPKEPVDKFEFRAWHVDTDSDRIVIAHRWVYHVNASWEEVAGKDHWFGKNGAPFVDQWQHFENDNFRGRMVGWQLELEPSFLARIFLDEAEAWVEAKRLLAQTKAHLEERIADIDTKIKRASTKA